MSNYETSGVSGSTGNVPVVVVIAGVAVMLGMGGSHAEVVPERHSSYQLSGTQSSIGDDLLFQSEGFQSYLDPSSGGQEVEALDGIKNFYEDFLSQQEPLGEQFSRVLYDNLWDLYES